MQSDWRPQLLSDGAYHGKWGRLLFREIDGAASKGGGTENQREERGKTSNVEELCKKGRHGKSV